MTKTADNDKNNFIYFTKESLEDKYPASMTEIKLGTFNCPTNYSIKSVSINQDLSTGIFKNSGALSRVDNKLFLDISELNFEIGAKLVISVTDNYNYTLNV